MINNVPIIFKNIAVIILGGAVLWIKSANILNGKDEKLMKSRFLKGWKKISKGNQSIID